MKPLVALVVLSLSLSAVAADRKPYEQINSADLTAETQVMSNASDSIDLIWWIPTEFWQAALSQDPSVSASQVEQIIGVLKPYSVLAVVQADISAFGAFNFYDRERVMNGLDITFIRENGRSVNVSHKSVSDPDMRLMLDQMRPILSAAMGNLGENFYFFPLPDTDAKGKRIISPYEYGTLRVSLDARKGEAPTVLELEVPLDSLFVPRVCPNGKAAHVTWRFCPWNGEPLK